MTSGSQSDIIRDPINITTNENRTNNEYKTND